MGNIRTYYDALKVSRDAPAEVIRSAYRALARKYHPDSNPDLEEAVKAMQELNQAFEVLIDPVQRKAHDKWIEQEIGGQAGRTSREPDRGIGRFSETNQQTEQARGSSRAGQSRPTWPNASKLKPGAVTGVVALAAALIALIVIALDSHDSSAETLAPASEATHSPTSASTSTPVSTPVATATPSPEAIITPASTPTPAPSLTTILETGQELFPGIPNAWIVKHSLDHTDPALPKNDPDNDNFTNAEEFHAGTSPVDSGSRPAEWSKLRVVSSSINNLRVKFESLPRGDLDVVQISTVSAEDPQTSTGASRLYRLMDFIQLSETSPDGKEVEVPTPLQIVEVRLVSHFNTRVNAEEDVPEVTLLNTANNQKFKLARGEKKDTPYSLAVIRDTLTNGRDFAVRQGQQFKLGTGGSYKLVEVFENTAAVQPSSSAERLLIPRLDSDELVRPVPAVAASHTPKPSPVAVPTATAFPSPQHGKSTLTLWTKFRLLGSSDIGKVQVKFTGLPGSSLSKVSINTSTFENSQQISSSTIFYQRGEMVLMAVPSTNGKRKYEETPFKVERAELRDRPNPTAKVKEKVPAVLLSNDVNGEKFMLHVGEVKELTVSLIILLDARSGDKEFSLRTGEQFTLDTGERCKLVEVSEEGAIVRNLITGERLLIPRFAPD